MPKNRAAAKTITLPLLDALDYLTAHGLTIDRLWYEADPANPARHRPHVTTKPKPPAKPSSSDA